MLILKDTIMPHLGEKISYTGADLSTAKKAMIMIHGRGASAENMVDLARHLKSEDTFLVIPQAANFSWYPNRFIEKRLSNEPGISSAFALIKSIVRALNGAGFSTRDIYMLGFSQGACLCADFCARNPDRYGGLFVLSGGLIGDVINSNDYQGNLLKTPVFLGCSTADFHIPEDRVHQSSTIFEALNADVSKRIYPNMGHTINMDEIDFINSLL